MEATNQKQPQEARKPCTSSAARTQHTEHRHTAAMRAHEKSAPIWESSISMNWQSRLGLIDAICPTLETSSRSVLIWKLSNYRDSIRYGHITLEEPLQRDHIRAHTKRTATSDIQQQHIRNQVSKSTVEEIHHIPTGLESVSPFTSAIILGANFR